MLYRQTEKLLDDAKNVNEVWEKLLDIDEAFARFKKARYDYIANLSGNLEECEIEARYFKEHCSRKMNFESRITGSLTVFWATYRKVLDKNRFDLMAARLRFRPSNRKRGIETRSNLSRCLILETRLVFFFFFVFLETRLESERLSVIVGENRAGAKDRGRRLTCTF